MTKRCNIRFDAAARGTGPGLASFSDQVDGWRSSPVLVVKSRQKVLTTCR